MCRLTEIKYLESCHWNYKESPAKVGKQVQEHPRAKKLIVLPLLLTVPIIASLNTT